MVKNYTEYTQYSPAVSLNNQEVYTPKILKEKDTRTRVSLGWSEFREEIPKGLSTQCFFNFPAKGFTGFSAAWTQQLEK